MLSSEDTCLSKCFQSDILLFPKPLRTENNFLAFLVVMACVICVDLSLSFSTDVGIMPSSKKLLHTSRQRRRQSQGNFSFPNVQNGSGFQPGSSSKSSRILRLAVKQPGYEDGQ